jgi:hypothetical protein
MTIFKIIDFYKVKLNDLIKKIIIQNLRTLPKWLYIVLLKFS